MAISRRFQVIAILILVVLCTNNIVRARRLALVNRDAASDDKDIIAAASTLLENSIPIYELHPLRDAVVNCAASSDKDLQRKFVLGTLIILSIFDEEREAEEAITKQEATRDIDLEEDFHERGAIQDVADTLTAGKTFLDLLNDDERQEYLKLLTRFLNAPSMQQKAYIALVTKYATKCANGDTSKKRAYLRRNMNKDKRLYNLNEY